MACCVRPSPALSALLWKNYHLKRIRWKALCLELLLPAIMLLLLFAVLATFTTDTFPEGWASKRGCPSGVLEETCSSAYINFAYSTFQFDRLLVLLTDWPVSFQKSEHSKFAIAAEDPQIIEVFREYMTRVGTQGGAVPNFRDMTIVVGDGSPEQLDAYRSSAEYGNPFSASSPFIPGAVVFQSMDFLTGTFEYTLRVESALAPSAYAAPSTNVPPVDTYETTIDVTNVDTYSNQGFLSMQQMVDTFIIDVVGERIENRTGNTSSFDRETLLPGDSTFIAFPKSSSSSTASLAEMLDLLQVFYISMFFVPLTQIIAGIVLEKERRTKNQLKVMGVDEAKIIGSWFLVYIIYFLVLALVVTVLALLILPLTGFSLVILGVFFSMGLATIALGFVISTFFSRTLNAVLAGLSFYFIGFFVYFYATTLEQPPTAVLLLPQVAFTLTTKTLHVAEASVGGTSIATAGNDIRGFAVATGIQWLLLDFVLYTILGGYLNATIPQETGRVLPWYFPLTPSFWRSWFRSCCGSSSGKKGTAASIDVEKGAASFELTSRSKHDSLVSLPSTEAVEEVEESLRNQKKKNIGIQIRNLRKVFDTPDGKKVAVDSLSLDVYEGQILVLLGHNGAGKTTTLQMLSGSLSPTSGEVYIYGQKLSTDLDVIRKSLGFCPQSNVLYPDLTVAQHLHFYCRLKGLQGNELELAVEKAMVSVGLVDKKKTKSKALSGGMKRKLSLAIALVGDSKVLFVDEPTSGVDPWSRRSMWEILQNHREGRVIILTTHFMDEADFLGDRIAIMSEGKLNCCASSLYLKQLYGAGYRLTLVKSDECEAEEVVKLVSNYVPESRVLSDVGTELSLQLPIASSGKFPDMLDSLDRAVGEETLGIQEYGISVTTLEEVFINAGKDGHELKEPQEAAMAPTVPTPAQPSGSSKVSYGRIFLALLFKRFLYARRDLGAFMCSAVLPIVIFAVGLTVGVLIPIRENDRPYLMKTQDLNPSFSSEQPFAIKLFGSNGSALELTDENALRSEHFPGFAVESIPTPSFPPGTTRTVFDVEYLDGINPATFCFPGSLELECRAPQAVSNAILDTGLYTLNSTAQESRNGASLFLAALRFPGKSLGRPLCMEYDGQSTAFSPNCASSSCFYREQVVDGVRRCLPDGCASELATPFPGEFVFRCEGNFCNSKAFAGDSCRGSDTNIDPNCIKDGLTQIIPFTPGNPPDPTATYCTPRAAQKCMMSSDTVDPQGSSTEVTCTDALDQCILEVGSSGSPCIPRGCQGQFNASILGDSSLFACTGVNCNVDCPSSRTCASPNFNPVEFSLAFFQPAPEVCDRIKTSQIGLVNTTAEHGPPILANAINTALLKTTMEKLGVDPSEADIKTYSHPWPLPQADIQFGAVLQGFITAMFFIFGFAFVPAPATQYVVLEKQEAKNMKHLQFVSGVPASLYWLSLLVFDLMAYIIPMTGAIVLLFIFDLDIFIRNIDAVVLVLVGFGLAVIPFSYIIGFLLKNHTSALVWAVGINLVSGIFLMTASFILNSTAKDFGNAVKPIFRIFPGFCLGDSLQQIVQLQVLEASRSFEEELGYGVTTVVPAALDQKVAGGNIVALYIEAVAYFLCVVVYEWIAASPAALRCIRSVLVACYLAKSEKEKNPLESQPELDVDVKEEEERVMSGGAQGEQVILKSLKKVYPGGKVAVRNVTIGIPEGICLGYIGINGAGKTTTMKMLTGDTFPTTGTGSLKGYDITYDQSNVRKHIGYCSQFSTLLDRLTVREHLELFCKIKHKGNTGPYVNLLLDRLTLRPFANKLAKSLSGGNKRKLSVAIAMIGSPDVLLLDEPSTGMDVVSKRFMWDLIEDLTQGVFNGKKTTVILTTHSMEECEALCNKVGIMVAGSLQCLGSIQHLKARFGQGFSVEVKLKFPSKQEISDFTEKYNIQASGILITTPNASAPANELVELCNALGNTDRIDLLMPGDKAPLIQNQVVNNRLDGAVFADWWLSESAFDVVDTFFNKNFSGTELVERHQTKLRYKVPSGNDTKVSALFAALEENKDALNISEYAVSQTTLEQIFNGFASKQEDERLHGDTNE